MLSPAGRALTLPSALTHERQDRQEHRTMDKPYAEMTIEELANVPMVQWEALAAGLGQSTGMEMDDQAAQYAVRYARLSAYIARRRQGADHARAVRDQNRAAAKVRHALGYTYKEDDISF